MPTDDVNLVLCCIAELDEFDKLFGRTDFPELEHLRNQNKEVLVLGFHEDRDDQGHVGSLDFAQGLQTTCFPGSTFAEYIKASRLPDSFLSFLARSEVRSWRIGRGECVSEFTLIVDLGLFDSLPAKEVDEYCNGLSELLVASGLLVCLSEEPEEYGALRRAMRKLRPAMGQRLAFKPLPLSGGSEIALHAYCKQVADKEISSTSRNSRPQQKRGSFLAPPAWAERPEKLLIQPARPNVNPERILAKSLEAANCVLDQPELDAVGSSVVKDLKEPEEFFSDSLEVGSLPLRGRGLVARKAILVGEVLLVSTALFIAPAQSLAARVVSWLRSPGTSSSDKQRFHYLFDGTSDFPLPPQGLFKDEEVGLPKHAQLPQLPLEKIYKILALNGLQADRLLSASAEDPGQEPPITVQWEGKHNTGLWPTISLLNHSCAPNATVVPVTSKTLTVVAACNIEPGEEVTVRYCDLEQPFQRRQAELKRQKEFDCACLRCSAERFAESMENIAGQTADQLSMLQHKAANLDHSHPETRAALCEFADRARKVLHDMADQWFSRLTEETSDASALRRATRSVFKAGFLGIFAASAMAMNNHVEDSCSRGFRIAAAEKKLEAWQEVCEIWEQVEPCSTSHLQAAKMYAAVAHRHCKVVDSLEWNQQDAITRLFAVWVGRHGSRQIVGQATGCIPDLGNRNHRRNLAAIFSKLFAPHESAVEWEKCLLTDAGIAATNFSLGNFGFWARFVADSKRRGVHAEEKSTIYSRHAGADDAGQKLGPSANRVVMGHSSSLAKCERSPAAANSICGSAPTGGTHTSTSSSSIADPSGDTSAVDPSSHNLRHTLECADDNLSYSLRVFDLEGVSETELSFTEARIRIVRRARVAEELDAVLEFNALAKLGKHIDETTVKAKFVRKSTQHHGPHLRVDFTVI